VFAVEWPRRLLPDDLIERVIFENPVGFLSQSEKFTIADARAAVSA
jgi:hypothetical protein